MPSETELLTSLFAAAMGGALSPRSVATPADEVATWEDFLSVLLEMTHADTVQMQLVENGRPLQFWQVGEDMDGLNMTESGQMRTSRVYSRSDLPAGLSPASETCPLRALRWRFGPDAWGVITLRRRSEDFRAIDGQHMSNLLPYLAPAVQGWKKRARERWRAALERRICAGFGSGWVLFSPSGLVTDMAEGLAERLEAVAGIRLSAEGRFLLSEENARALREALSELARDSTGTHVLWLSSAPPVQMMLSVENGELLGRIRHEMSARALPLSQVMAAFNLNRSEARLAVALCDGLSLSEAAEKLGWTLESTRTTSKRLFARMGVTGQPGVVRAMYQSVVWSRMEI
ncbi:helix-turn-helix transcriptional regulator [Celeribacter halophilus]|uniref:helix-turn-helix transcriptional regulator n=1 Tax=Celeribacter halophilus TaxID=576117 RepID=UPI003A9118E6